MHSSLQNLSICAVCAAFIGACSPALTRTEALSTETERQAERSSCTVVFLPGAGDTPEHFATHGFLEWTEAAVPDAEILSIPALVPDYNDPGFPERLRTALGDREHVWLVGVSMGGGGALRSAALFEDANVVALAPYLGGFRRARHVRGAEGASQLFNAQGPRDEDLHYDRAWRFTAEHPDRVFLGWGRYDIIASMSESLSMELPRSHVFQGSGDHKWVVWRDLYRAFLDSGFLQRDCGVARR